MADRALEWFADWFASKGGVWQTAVLVLAWTAVALVWRRIDPHLFATMAILTVYSAVTQPVLAYCSRRAAAKADGDAAAMKAEEDQILRVVEAHCVSCVCQIVKGGDA